MSRINSNLIYIWNAFRKLNAIKADKETTPELTPEVTPEVTPEIAPEIAPEVAPEITPEVAPEVTPEVAPSDEVELGASHKSWPCGSMAEYVKKKEGEYCFNFDKNVESAEFGSFNVAQKHNNTTVHMLILDGEWLINNRSSTFHISNLQGNKLWIQWPYSIAGWNRMYAAKASYTSVATWNSDLATYGGNQAKIMGAEVTIHAYKTGNDKSRVSKIAKNTVYQKDFWDHKFGKQL